MIRGGTTWRIGGPVLCALAAIAIAAPATASGQAAVEEYTLDIPGGGGTNPGDPTAPTAAASGSGGGGEGRNDGGKGSGSGAGASGASGTSESSELGADGVNLSSLQEGSGHAALPTDSRSAPEVVADSLTSSSMLPILGALALITAVGGWRLLRSRRLTGVTG